MKFWPAEQIQPIVREFQSTIDDLFTAPFSLEGLDDFPYTVYSSNLVRYKELMDWFSGRALIPQDPDAVTEDYPVRINPINATCLKHGYALFGEVQEDGRPLVVPKLVPDVPKEQKKTAREQARAAEMILNRILWENFSRTIYMRNGITSQILGGSVLHLRVLPESQARIYPIQIQRISPEMFVGFPMPGDEYRLREAWIVQPISREDVAAYGIEPRQKDEKFYWIEKWTPEERRITINDKVVKYTTRSGREFKGEGKNEFGFVPMVYIPHIRVGSFYGENQIDQLIGLVKEMNFRWGDAGDAFNADSHTYIAIRNTNGNPQVVRLAPGLDALDLGSSDVLSGDKHEPDAFEIKKQGVSTTHVQMLNLLMDQYRRDAFLPKVADGEDEGSQRSGETLKARMWPLKAHIEQERVFWTDGLSWLNWMLLSILKLNGIGNIGQEHLDMRVRQEWSPMLPKDREVFINECVSRAASDLGSPQHLIEMMGDVEDIDEELEHILEWKKRVSEINTESEARLNKAQQQNLEAQARRKGSDKEQSEREQTRQIAKNNSRPKVNE